MIRRRKRQPIVVPLVSFGDMAFLLIIFFILAGNFMKDNFQMDNPKSMDVLPQDAAQVVVAMDKDGVLWIQGQRARPTDLAAALDIATGGHTNRPVFVRIHKNIEQQEFLPVLEGLSEARVKVILAGDRGESQ